MKTKYNSLDLMLIIVSVLFTLSSLYLAIKCDRSDLFSRSGSIMILFGAIVEYRRITQVDKKNEYNGGPIGMIEMRELFNVPSPIRKIRFITSFMIILGTMVWGYGDLFL